MSDQRDHSDLEADEVTDELTEKLADGERTGAAPTPSGPLAAVSDQPARPEEPVAEILWDLLDGRVFAQLDRAQIQVLAETAHRTERSRPGLDPAAALAAIALWRHGPEAVATRAVELLRETALPDDPGWLYELVDRLIRLDGDCLGRRSLLALARLQLGGNFWEPAALLAGLYLVHEYAPSWIGSPMLQLVDACDRAAEERPKVTRPWLDLMADASVGGHLHEPWLEKPMRAAIRLSIDHPERHEKLRRWHERRPYDADHARLEQLFGDLLDRLEGPPGELRAHAWRIIDGEVDRCLTHNPVRAQRLVELVVMRRYAPPVGTRALRLRSALERMAQRPEIDRFEKLLVCLYVRNFHIDPTAVRTVRRLADRIEWIHPEDAPEGVDPLDAYLMIGDYDHAFEELSYSLDGVTLEHADMEAAARLTFYVQKRLDPNTLARLVRRMWRPLDWLSRKVTRLGAIARLADGALGFFERRVAQLDLREEVVAEYARAGIELTSFEEIGRLNLRQVDAQVRRHKSVRLLFGAAAGGASGGLSPFSWPWLSLADAPVLLGITADICSRFCWYYGFDPRRHPELPVEIMAVAMNSAHAGSSEQMRLRRALRSYALRKSIVVGALAHGTVTQLAGRALRLVMRQETSHADQQRAILQRSDGVATDAPSVPSVRAPSRTLAVMGGMLGASLNVALLYDICEAARAVLTDRFLQRKYPDWAPKFEAGPTHEPLDS